MQPDRFELQPLAGTRVYFTGQVAPDKGRGNTRQLGGIWALCLSPIEINGREFRQAHMHMWVSLPISVIQAARDHPQLQVRGFATVALYQRDNGTLAYGLNHAHDLEIQTGPGSGWCPPQPHQPLRADAGVPVPATYATIPAATQQRHRTAWTDYYSRILKTAHTKVFVYRKTSEHPHDTHYRSVIERVQLVLHDGNLPCAQDMNVVYYLIGTWAPGQAPRHLRTALEAECPVNTA